METKETYAEAIVFHILHKEHAPLTLNQIKGQLKCYIPDELLVSILSKLTQQNKIQKHSFASSSKKSSSATLYWTEDIFGAKSKDCSSASNSDQNLKQSKVDEVNESTPETTKAKAYHIFLIKKAPASKKRLQPFKSNTPFKTPWKNTTTNDSSNNNNTSTTPVNKRLKVGISTPTKLEELDVDTMTRDQLLNEVQRLSQMLTKKKEQYQQLKQQIDSNDKPQVMNEDGRLDPLIKKWTRACQKVLLELQHKAKEETTIGALLDHFAVEEDMRKTLGYVPEVDEFQ